MKQPLLNLSLVLAMVGLLSTTALQGAGDSTTSTCEVTSSADGGSGTLRDCLLNAQQGEVITFNTAVFPPNSPVTILLTTQLPALISGDVAVDALDAGVILDGGNTVHNGLTIRSDDNRISGLEITRFSIYGIYIDGSDNAVDGFITDCDTGIAISGMGSASNVIGGQIYGCRIGIRIDPQEQQDPQVDYHEILDCWIGGSPWGYSNGNDIGIVVASGQEHRLTFTVIAHNDIGIRVEGDAALHAGGSPHNCLFSNTVGFSHAGTVADLIFENNWWNAADGPSGVGPGSGDSIEELGNGTVDYEPWLTEPSPTCGGRDLIFEDGFETGDTSAWSKDVP